LGGTWATWAIANRLDFQVTLDKNPHICGIYPRFNEKLCGIEQSISFISDDWRLFRLKTLNLMYHTFVKKSGLDRWHKRLGHISNDTIVRTVGHSKGIGNIPKKIPRRTNCPDCMIGKCQRQDAPSTRVEKTQHTLQQLNWDLAMFNQISFEGFRYAVIITDSFSGLIWVNYLKTKALKKWYCDIAPLREHCRLVTFMRDNTGENRSYEAEEFIQSIGVQSRYSAPYEQWQDGQPESAIRTLTRLARSMKTESGVSVRFWFHMLVAAANASNATNKQRLDSTPHRIAYSVKKDISKFRIFGCKAIMYLEDVRRDGPGKLADRAAEWINLGLTIDQNTNGYKIYLPKEETIRITNQVRFDESIFFMSCSRLLSTTPL